MGEKYSILKHCPTKFDTLWPTKTYNAEYVCSVVVTSTLKIQMGPHGLYTNKITTKCRETLVSSAGQVLTK